LTADQRGPPVKTQFALADDNGVVTVLGAARVLLSGFVLGEQSDQVRVGEWQVVDDASTPTGNTVSAVARRDAPAPAMSASQTSVSR
jgi:hypothetical protein